MRPSIAVLAAVLALSFAACATVDDTPPPSASTPAADPMTSAGGYGGGTTASTTPTPTAEPMTSGVYGGTTPSTTTPSESSQSKTVLVGLNEYRIDIPDSLPAGLVTLHVTNYGSIPHSFGIRSDSATGTPGYGGTGTTGYGSDSYDRSLPSPLQPGQTATLEVELKQGSYVSYCPVGNHVSTHGMTRTVTVK
jgi:hypothetical protein